MSYVVEILESFLGQSRGHNQSSGQMQFDCPRCSEEQGKPQGNGRGNLEINYNKGWYHCWSCGESHRMKGRVTHLISRYGGAKALKDFLLIKPEFIYKTELGETHTTKLPKEYKRLSEKNKSLFKYNDAMSYLKKRGITKELIDFYKIGFCSSGKYDGRIIIPSYDQHQQLNFFVGRTFEKWRKPKILNEETNKDLMVFNEGLINWDATIYLVEGPFDHIITPNSIPLLGKYISPYLFNLLLTRANAKIIIVLDGDAFNDTKKLYKKLNVLNLRGRINVIQLNVDYDPSFINQKYGRLNYLKILGQPKTIKESSL